MTSSGKKKYPGFFHLTSINLFHLKRSKQNILNFCKFLKKSTSKSKVLKPVCVQSLKRLNQESKLCTSPPKTMLQVSKVKSDN